MNNHKMNLKRIIIGFLMILFLTSGANSIVDPLSFTQEEQDYIENRGVITAASIDGGAPLHYKNSKGEIIGIAVSILDEIEEMTGLNFEYKLYESIDEVFKSDTDLIFGLTPHYAPDEMVLSETYLESETILFVNSSVDPSNLENKRFAAIKGGKLPEGIKEENAIYYYSREDSLKAVDKGEADYGYGNEYSLAFYTLQKGYENIVTIPIAKESRGYAIGFAKEDVILLSIINKSIRALDEGQMHQIILKMASQVEREITLPMIVRSYWEIILALSVLIIGVLIWGIISITRSKKDLILQNKRYELLSQISNEYFFEYYVSSDNLKLSEKSMKLFGTKENIEIINNKLKSAILNGGSDEETPTLNIPLSDNENGIFKVVNSIVNDDRGRAIYIIGKLINISKEEAEKERLIIKTQIDGLTGIYNATTMRNLICERIANNNNQWIDAFLLIDCDRFKNINDSFGHLAGDQALKNVSKALRKTFRESDIIGRVGGDEFAVYMKNIPSPEFVQKKAEKLIKEVQEMDKKFNLTLSIGIAFLNNEKNYTEIFKKADIALYEAKRTGRAKAVSLELP